MYIIKSTQNQFTCLTNFKCALTIVNYMQVVLQHIPRTFSFFFLFFWGGAPVACGGSQARGPIGATAAGLYNNHSHSNPDPSCVCGLHRRSSRHRQILNPMSKARD